MQSSRTQQATLAHNDLVLNAFRVLALSNIAVVPHLAIVPDGGASPSSAQAARIPFDGVFNRRAT